jgi:GAF domain-containing protein
VDPEEAEMQRRRRTGMKGRRTRRPKARKTPTAPVSITILKEQVAALTHDLKEAREQRTATAEVLRVISSSSGELNRVFKEMLGKATQICGASFGTLLLFEGNGFRRVAAHNAPHEYTQFADREPFIRLGRARGLDRLTKTKEPVQFADMANAEPNSPLTKLGGARTYFAVPMLKENELIGAIGIYRQEVRPFTEEQIELVENFAAQAVIAIENARLLNELRQRTTDLSESLDEQTATADVLRVISSSAGELKPVFEAMLKNAIRICEAKFGNLFLIEGDACSWAAGVGTPPKLAEYFTQTTPFKPTPGGHVDRVMQTKQVSHTADDAAEPVIGAAARFGGARSSVCVPMLKDDALVGVIFIYRTEVRPFTEKQIELLKNFAAQAVIAIENTRLLNELRQSLEQQTATSEVLRVISSSPGELEPVFQAMLENAVRICEAMFGTLFLRDGDVFRFAADVGSPPALAEHNRRLGLVPTPGTTLDQVMRTKQVSHTADAAAAAVPGYSARLGGARSLVAVPMLKDDQLVGVVRIYRQEVRPFTDKQIELVKNFAAQAVIAIENTRLLNELRQSLEQQTATAEILGVISKSVSDAQPVFDAIVQSGVRLFSGATVSIALAEGDMVKAAAVAESDPGRAEAWRKVFPFPLTREYMHSAAILDRKMLDFPDVENAPPELAVGAKNFLRSGYRAVTIVPLMRGETAIGALSVVRVSPGSLSDKQLAALKAYANQAIIALENARLLNELRQRTDDLTESLEQQTATSKVLEVISRSAFDLQAVFETVAESSVRLCKADRAFIYRFDGELLRMVGAFNAPEKLKDFRSRNPIRLGRYSAAGRAGLERRTIHIPDALADPEYTYSAKDLEKLRTNLAVPILKGDDLLGVLVIYHLEEVRPFTDKQIALVETFADQAAIAIDNVRLLEELRQSLQQQTATAEVLKVISRSTFDLKSVLNTLVESIARLCEADMAAIRRPKGSAFLHVASHGSPTEYDEYMQSHPIEPNRGTVAGRVLLEGKPVHIADVQADPDYTMVDISRRTGYHTILGLPLLREGSPIGVVILGRTTLRPFTEKQVDLATTFADQAVIAIENVRLFDEIQDKSRQLEVASQHKSQFLANMSHELRTPLNAILGYTELMADGAYGEPSEKMLGILKRLEANGKHLLGLINDVLDLSKIEAGQLVLELSDYSIQDIAQTVRSTLEPLAADKKLGFKVEVAPQLPSGHGDGRRLTQVLINLVGNAIKFTDAGEIVIKADASNGSFCVSVRDTGPGISAADQTRLFQEFQQADNAITRKKGGTGLGLAISKRIIEMHGGRIWVESQPGEGSTFTFTLPVIVEQQAEPT